MGLEERSTLFRMLPVDTGHVSCNTLQVDLQLIGNPSISTSCAVHTTRPLHGLVGESSVVYA